MRNRNPIDGILGALACALGLAACSGDGPAGIEQGADEITATIDQAGGTVVVPSGFAGISIPPDAFDGPASVTIRRLPDPSTTGDGPLPTDLEQYPLFYEVSATRAPLREVTVGVCVVEPPDPRAPPLEVIPELRLAHRNPEVGTEVEILALAAAPFLDCAGAATAANAPADGSWLAGLGRRLGRVGGRIGDVLGPRSLHAAEMARGLGGLAGSFSPFGAVRLRDLRGRWVGNYPCCGPETISVAQTGELAVATKVTGDAYVPAGEITWRADVRTGEASHQIANIGFVNPMFIPARLEIVSENRIVIRILATQETLTFDRVPDG